MNHEAHVGLVDAHAERHRRHDHVDVIALKGFLIARPHVGLETGVIRQGTNALCRQELRRLIHAFSALAVHDAAFAITRANECQHFGARISALPFLARRDLQIGSKERALEASWLAHAELL